MICSENQLEARFGNIFHAPTKKLGVEITLKSLVNGARNLIGDLMCVINATGANAMNSLIFSLYSGFSLRRRNFMVVPML